MSNVKVFEYKGTEVSFDFGDGQKMINATEMAKSFGKLPADFIRLKQTQDFIGVLESRYGNSHNGSSHIPDSDTRNTPADEYYGNSHITSVFFTRPGNSELSGTWMHEKLALKFAAWLSPEFEFWVYDRIQELLTTGSTHIVDEVYRKVLNDNERVRGLVKQVFELIGTKQKSYHLLSYKTYGLNETYLRQFMNGELTLDPKKLSALEIDAKHIICLYEKEDLIVAEMMDYFLNHSPIEMMDFLSRAVQDERDRTGREFKDLYSFAMKSAQIMAGYSVRK